MPICPDQDNEGFSKPLALLEGGYGWDLGGEGEYMAPAAVVLEAFMGLSDPEIEDIVYGEIGFDQSETYNTLLQIESLGHAANKLSPIVRKKQDPEVEVSPYWEGQYENPIKEEGAAFQKYGTIRTYFDLFRKYLIEVNNPYNLFERLKTIKAKLVEYNPGNQLASEAGSEVHTYYLSMKTNLIIKIKEAIEAGEVEDAITTHTFPARTYAKLASEKWSKVMTGAKMTQETKESIDWTNLNEFFDEQSSWYKTWAGVHWEENTEELLEKIMYRISDSRYFNARNLDYVKLISEGKDLVPGADCGPPSYGAARKPKQSILRPEDIKVMVTERMEEALCKNNYPQEAGKAIGKGLIMTLIRLYVVEYALQSIFVISQYKFSELCRNKIFLDYFIKTILDNVLSHSSIFYDMFIEDCTEIVDERIKLQASLLEEVENLNLVINLLEKYSIKDGQTMVAGYSIRSMSQKSAAISKINADIDSKLLDLEKVRIIDPVTGGPPKQMTLSSVLPKIPFGAPPEIMQETQAKIRAAKRERASYLLSEEIVNLSEEINLRIAKQKFAPLEDLTVGWLKENAYGLAPGKIPASGDGMDQTVRNRIWIDSMPKVSDKNTIDFLAGLASSDPSAVSYNTILGPSEHEIKLYGSPSLDDAGQPLVAAEVPVITLSHRVKQVLDSNRRYFQDGNLSVAIESDKFDELKGLITEQAVYGAEGIDLYEAAGTLSSYVDNAVYTTEDETDNFDSDTMSIFTERGKHTRNKGRLMLQPFLHIEKANGYPTLETIQNLTDPDEIKLVTSDLHYLNLINRLNL